MRDLFKRKDGGKLSYWTGNDNVKLQLDPPSDLAESYLHGSSPYDEDYDRFATSELSFSFKEGLARLTLNMEDFDDGDSPYCFVYEHKRLDLCVSFFHEGGYHSFTLSETSTKFTCDHYSNYMSPYISHTWRLQPCIKDVERLAHAVHDGHRRVQFVVAGYVSTDWPYSNSRRTNDSKLCNPYFSLASLMTSTSSDYVLLKPSVPADETRVVRVHSGILCESSNYFSTLLRSDFAEGSTLRQYRGPDSNALSPYTKTCDNFANTLTGSELDHSSNTPVKKTPLIQLHDLTYRQLESLVYYVCTGLAVFGPCRHRQTKTLPAEGTGESSPNGIPNRYQKRKRPWLRGLLDPAEVIDVFRVADMYGFADLRAKALQHIAATISVRRLRSDVAQHEEVTLFPEIKALYRRYCQIHKPEIVNAYADHNDIFETLDLAHEETSDVDNKENVLEHSAAPTKLII